MGRRNKSKGQTARKTVYEYPMLEAKMQEKLNSLFPEWNLTGIRPHVSPGSELDIIAEWTMENLHNFNRKPVVKRHITDELEPTIIYMDEIDHRFMPKKRRIESNKLQDLLVDEAVSALENQVLKMRNEGFDLGECTRMLMQRFPEVRSILVEHLVNEFNGNFYPSALSCFLVTLRQVDSLRRFFLHVNTNAWATMTSLMPPRKKRQNLFLPTNNRLKEQSTRFDDFLHSIQDHYGRIFVDDNVHSFSLKPNSNEFTEIIPSFQCLVCFENCPIELGVSCSVIQTNEPSSSKKLETHRFCKQCIKGHAEAATTEIPLARGAIGLKCMDPECENSLLFSEIRVLIPVRVQRILNDRIVEENLGSVKLPNLERCNKCNYAVILEVPKEVDKVFKCLKCEYQYCRICERPWDDDHFGFKCEELDAKEKIDRRHREMEKRMNEAIVHKCQKCNLTFIKQDGCNKVVCRCGATECYVCRKQNINYDHFCQHVRNPVQKTCNLCKKCGIWENTNKRDQDILKQIQKEVEKQDQPSLVQAQESGPSTSKVEFSTKLRPRKQPS